MATESEQNDGATQSPPSIHIDASVEAKVKDDFALAQFNSLRTEILQLISMQGQLISANVVALGVLLSIAVQAKNAGIILIYPMVSLILGLTWLNHAHSIVRTSGFIALHESKHLGSEGWESHLRTLDSTLFNKVGYWGVRSAFPGGAVLSVIAALLIGVHGAVSWIAFSISAAIAVGCVAIFVMLREASHEIEDGSSLVQSARAIPDIDGSTGSALTQGDAAVPHGRPAIGGGSSPANASLADSGLRPEESDISPSPPRG